MRSHRRHIGFEPRTGRTTKVTLQTQHGPAVFPCDGSQRHRATDGVEVHHEQSPPLSALVFNDATLVDVAACRSILIDSGNGKARTILANAILYVIGNLRQWCCMIAKGLVSCNGDGLIGAPDALGTRTECTTVGLVIGRNEVVHATYLIHVVTLAHSIALRNDDALGSLDRTTHVCLQLCTFHLTIAMNGVDLAIVVEEYGEVVDASLHVMVLPRTTNIFGGITLQALAVDVRENVELSVGIADGWRPDALTVDLLVVLQGEGIVVEVKAVEAIRDVLPVDQVLRVKDDEARHRVHCGTCQIIVIAHPQDVGIGELVVEQWVGIGAIAIICCPTLREGVAK